LIPGSFEVDTVGFEVPCETTVVACSLAISGGIYIAFNMLAFSACFGGMIVHFAVCAFELLASHSVSTSTSVTLSTTATMFTTGV
jgi:hypothetical protein